MPVLPKAEQAIHSLWPSDIAGAGKEDTAAAAATVAPAALRKPLLFIDFLFTIYYSSL